MCSIQFCLLIPLGRVNQDEIVFINNYFEQASQVSKILGINFEFSINLLNVAV